MSPPWEIWQSLGPLGCRFEGPAQKNSNQTFRTNILYLPDIRNIYIYSLYLYEMYIYIYICVSYVYPALTLVTIVPQKVHT